MSAFSLGWDGQADSARRDTSRVADGRRLEDCGSAVLQAGMLKEHAISKVCPWPIARIDRGGLSRSI